MDQFVRLNDFQLHYLDHPGDDPLLLTLYMAAHHPERISKLVVIDAAGSMHPQVRELIKPSKGLCMVEAIIAFLRQ